MSKKRITTPATTKHITHPERLVLENDQRITVNAYSRPAEEDPKLVTLMTLNLENGATCDILVDHPTTAELKRPGCRPIRYVLQWQAGVIWKRAEVTHDEARQVANSIIPFELAW